MHILGSFGRYAQSQFQKIQRSLIRDQALTELLAVMRAGQLDNREQAAAFLARAAHISRAQEAATNSRPVCARSAIAGCCPRRRLRHCSRRCGLDGGGAASASAPSQECL